MPSFTHPIAPRQRPDVELQEHPDSEVGRKGAKLSAISDAFWSEADLYPPDPWSLR